MSTYTIYSKNSGEIQRCVDCPDDMLQLQLAEGEDAVVGRFSPSLHFIQLGDVHEYTQDQAQSKAVRPDWAEEWSNEAMAWLDSRQAAEIIAAVQAMALSALDSIDKAAEAARLRYISGGFGQETTYARKEAQAREWQDSGFSGEAPPFIAAEADALGIDRQALALQVIALADFWGGEKAPQIEATRRKWKVAVQSAGLDLRSVEETLNAGLTALALL